MHGDLQAAAQEAGLTDIGAAEEDADAAGQQQGDQTEVNSPCKQSHAVLLKALPVKCGIWSEASESGPSAFHSGTCGDCNQSGTYLNAQEAAAPSNPPRQARPSCLGAAQAGPQGASGQSSAAQHADQAPTGPQERMQEANPYRSLGKPVLPCLNPCRFAGFYFEHL